MYHMCTFIFNVQFTCQLNMEEMKMKEFYIETANYPILNNDETNKLIASYQNSDDEGLRNAAKETLVLHNMRLVYSVIKDVTRGNRSYYSDLVSYGAEGIMVAVDKYDLNSEASFSTYAYNWIRKKVYDAYRKISNTIAIPSDVYEDLNRFTKAYAKFVEENLRKPTFEYCYDDEESEMMTILCHDENNPMPIANYKKAVDAFNSRVFKSYDDPIGNDGNDVITLGDCIADKRHDDNSQFFYDAIDAMKKDLKDGEMVAQVILLKVDGYKGSDIAQKLNISRGVYRRLEKEGLDYLKNNENLKEIYG